MDLCDTEFLDLNRTWYTNQPELSPCFRNTVLVWLPACILVICVANEVSNIRQAKLRQTKPISVNWFNALRLLLVIVLFCLKVSEVILLIYRLASHQEHLQFDQVISGSLAQSERAQYVISSLLAPVIQCISYLILGVIFHYQRKAGIHTSGPVWFYLSMSVICAAFDYYNVISGNHSFLNIVSLYVSYAHTPVLGVLFILECRGDTPIVDINQQDANDDVRPTNPEVSASYCSSITFWWYNSFLLYGYRSKLRLGDLWKTLPRDKSCILAPVFCDKWLQTGSKVRAIKGDKRRETYCRSDGKTQGSSDITRVLLKLFGKQLVIAAFMKLVQDLLQYATPSILKAILAYLKTDQFTWHGTFFALLLLIVPSLQSIILGNYFYRMQLIGLHTRAMIMGAVYRKAIFLSGSSRLQSTSGEIVNLMSVDAQRFQDLLIYINLIWSAPLQIALAVTLLYQELGWPIFAGVICMALFMPSNAYLARKIKMSQVELMKTKDQRIKHINELFGGIRVVKLYAWENSFMANLFKFRNLELGFLGKILTLDATQTFLWQCSPFIVACVTFAVYVSVDSANVLDAEKAFVSISLFNLLRFPLSMLPSLVTSFVLTMVSAKRLNKFLNSDELVRYVTRDPSADAITIDGATMAWTTPNQGEDGPGEELQLVLKDVSLKVKPKSFVAVVGQVASGKTSLISSMLGEMHLVAGRFNICEGLTIAYVPQRAFIQNMSVRDNIIFGMPFDEERYNTVLAACALYADLETLPGGDLAEIGEKGINLSGGQKQRVSLARACYSDSDIYLLDDPLSALDSHVAKHVYDEVLNSSTGLLRHKTRVLATNSLFVLPNVDHIVVLDGGQVAESGSYQKLMSVANGNLAEIMRQYNVNQETNKDVANEVQSAEETAKSSVSDAIAPLTSLVVSGSNVGKLIDAEKMEEGTVGFHVYFTYFFTSYTPLWLFATVIALCAFSGFNVATSIWLSIWSSDADKPERLKDTDLRTTRLVVYATLGALQCITVLLGSLALSQGAVRAARKLHTALLDRVMRSPMTFFDTTPMGRIVNRFAKDIDVVDSILPGTFRSWLNCLLGVLSTLFITTYTFPGLLILMLPLACVYVLVQRVFIVTTRQLKRLESTTRSPIYSNFSETLSGVSTIRAYGCIDRFIKYSDDVVDRNQSCSYPNVIANRWLSNRVELFGNLITCSAALFAVAYEVSAGEAGLVISYSLSITQTLSWLVRMNSDLETHIVSVERILEYTNNEQEDDWIKEDSRPPHDWPQTGAIHIQHYSTRYRKETDLVLRDISLNIRPREKIGIVGRTGSGKSSLSLSLFRILERVAGSISIDSSDITKFGLHDIRSRLTIIPQDPVLFSGTLRFNLDPLNLYSDLDIWRALELAHLRSHVNAVGAGLEYQVSEFGENFSVGQRQLICLARAILRKTRILVLDEATASVDLETDAVVQRTIRDVFKDCTIITIAHRLHTILDSDRILVLDSGRILELGKPEELIRNENSAFVSLIRDAGMDLNQLKADIPLTTTNL